MDCLKTRQCVGASHGRRPALGPAPWGSGHSRQPDPEVASPSHSLCLCGVTGNVGERNGHTYFVFGLETALKLLPSLVQQPPNLESEHLPLPWRGHDGQGALLEWKRWGRRLLAPSWAQPGTIIAAPLA